MKYWQRVHPVILLSLLTSCVTTLASAAQSTQVARPDLSGVWSIEADHYNPRDRSSFPESQWSVERLPFTLQGRAAFDANKPGRGPRTVKPELVNDSQYSANPNGLYRALQYSRPFEFGNLSGKVVQLFGWGLAWRIIHTDGRPVPDNVAAGPFWYGYSVGRWEDDVLVVTTLALDERAWLDEWGTPFSAEARIEERWRRVKPDALQLTISVRDPTYYTRPWTSGPITYRLQKKDVEPLEIIFAPMDVESFNQTLRNPAAPKN
jgi:hypothetical protein